MTHLIIITLLTTIITTLLAVTISRKYTRLFEGCVEVNQENSLIQFFALTLLLGIISTMNLYLIVDLIIKSINITV